MARPARPFALYKKFRKNRKNYVYYAKIRDPETGAYTRTVSTGETSRARAEEWTRRLLDSEAASQVKQQIHAERVTVKELSRGFWETDGAYAESRRARGKTISNGYLSISESYTRNHILPRWGSKPVAEITTPAVDKWILELHKSGKIAPATTNRILQTFRILLDGAVANEYIRTNPATEVKPVQIVHQERGVLTDREVRRLFADPALFPDYRMYAANLLAFTTGARMGEVRGLLVDDVHRDHIVIQHSWEEGHGLKEPKYGSVRAVPIGPRVYDALDTVIREYRPEAIVFYGFNGDRSVPVSKTHINKSLVYALVNLRLPESMRNDTKKRERIARVYAERRVTFHSWRHKLNTVLRTAGVPDSKIRLLTGHRGEAMTNWYTRFTHADFQDVRGVQDRMLEEKHPAV